MSFRYSRPSTVLVLIISICCAPIVSISGTDENLVQVTQLLRHSVREPRDTSTLETGAQLLDSAYDRLFLNGHGLRQLYPNFLSTTYKPSEFWANSSAWARTQQTAHGTIAGLYPYLNNVTRSIPVMSNSWEFDWTIYNYDKCPAYDASMAAFIASPEFNAQKTKYSNLTTFLNNLLAPKTPITLVNLFSTWDLFWITRNRPEVGQLAPSIDDDTYNQMTEATTYIETMRYSTRISRQFLGSTTLGAIKYRQDMLRALNPTFSHKFLLYAGHYATQLNLLAALNYTGIVSQSIPDYNSALVFELYNQTDTPSGWGLKINYYDGVWSIDGVPNIKRSISLTALGCTEGTACMYDYDQFWSMYHVKNLPQYCFDCESTLWMCTGANPVQRCNTTTTMGTNPAGQANSTCPTPLRSNATSFAPQLWMLTLLLALNWMSPKQ